MRRQWEIASWDDVDGSRSTRRVRGEGSTHAWVQTASELRRSYDRLQAAHELIAPISLVRFHAGSQEGCGEDATRLAATLRPADSLGAWQAGQLVLLLPDTPLVGGRRVVQRLGSLLGRTARRWRYGLGQVEAGASLQAALEGAADLLPLPTLRLPPVVRGAVHASVDWEELCDLLGWLGRCSRSGQLVLQDQNGRRGQLELRGGRVVGARAASGRVGRAAALEVLDVTAARLRLVPARELAAPAGPPEEALNATTLELLLEVARRRDEACAPTERYAQQLA